MFQTQRLNEVKREEYELLEAQSIPLRNYLMKHVMPTLTQGLIECCKTRPDDAIDYLVSYIPLSELCLLVHYGGNKFILVTQAHGYVIVVASLSFFLPMFLSAFELCSRQDQQTSSHASYFYYFI